MIISKILFDLLPSIKSQTKPFEDYCVKISYQFLCSILRFETNFLRFFQLINTYSEQSLEKISILHNDLKYLSKCNGSSGDKSCYIPRGGLNTLSSTNENESSFCDLNTNSYFTSEIDTSFDNTVNVDNNDEDWNEPPEGDLFDMVIDSATPAIGDRWRGCK